MLKNIMLAVATLTLLSACATQPQMPAQMRGTQKAPCCATCKTCQEACCCKDAPCPLTKDKASQGDCCCSCCNKS